MENKEKSSEEIEKSLKWAAILFYIYLHLFGLAGFYFLFSSAKWMTIFYFMFLITMSSIGLTVGAHRLYAHQTFSAKSELKFFLIIVHTLAGVGSIYNWVFWHRIHHKYYGTERDPYNHKKGFFYSHVYSNLLSAPSNLDTYARNIDMYDMQTDMYVWVQNKFYWLLFIVIGLLIPLNIPMLYWDESLVNSILIIGALRLVVTTNIAWLVNSAMLLWGLKKGEKYPIDDNSIFFLWKDYWMNYHYMIPWDWKNNEFGHYENGFMTFIIKMWFELGLVSNMMTVDNKMIQDFLYKVASKEITMDDALDKMKEHATENALKEKLTYYH